MTLPVECVLCSHNCPPSLSLQSSMPAIMTMLADHAAQQLLDFNQKLDINLLDNVVNCLYHGVGPQVTSEADTKKKVIRLYSTCDISVKVDLNLSFNQDICQTFPFHASSLLLIHHLVVLYNMLFPVQPVK